MQPLRNRAVVRLALVAAAALAATIALPAAVAQAAPAATHAPRPAATGSFGPQWPSAGANAYNTRDASSEHLLNVDNVGQLQTKWVFTGAGDFPATPTIYDGVAYAPDLGGNLWAISTATGEPLWSNTVTSYTGVAGDTSRLSPAIWGNELVSGDGSFYTASGGAHIFAANRVTGAPLWSTEVDPDPFSQITSSPIVVDGIVFVGVSSRDFAVLPPSECCTFRGSIVALDAFNGHVLWQTYTDPSNGGQLGGYSGASVWGSTPVIDQQTGMLYIGTGNNYTVPAGVCTIPGEKNCTAPVNDDYVDSVLGIDMWTGQVKWAYHTLTTDVFTFACTDPGVTCGPDFDFGSGGNLFTADIAGRQRQLLGYGQKNGVYYALDPRTGKLVWRTLLGPGGENGGIEWGTAADGQRIYVASSGSSGQPYTITSASGVQTTITYGSWAALDPATGKILWQTADPTGADDPGFVSVANGVVYAPSNASSGTNMYAINAKTGQVIWSFASGGAVTGGAAIVDGTVYWGSGYYTATGCQPGPTCGFNDQLYAFSLSSGSFQRRPYRD